MLGPKTSLVYLLVLLSVFSISTLGDEISDTTKTQTRNTNEEKEIPQTHNAIKRNTNWKSLQGSWGKRDGQDADLDDLEYYDTLDKRGDWSNFRGSWGKRANWRQLQGSWGKRVPMDEEVILDPTIARLLTNIHIQDELNMHNNHINEIDDSPIDKVEEEKPVIKRSWAKFAGSWGKRPYNPKSISQRANRWSNFRGSWGKRANGWQGLQGSWGKRAPPQWSQLKGSWGKRDQDDEVENIPGGLLME